MMNKKDLMNFLRKEQKQLNVCFYCNDFEFADRLLKFIQSLPRDEATSVRENEQAKEDDVMCSEVTTKECLKHEDCLGCKGFYK